MSSFNVTFEENSGSMFSKILANVITEYFREHPSDRISAEELASAVNGYLSEHPIEGMTAEEVNGLISAYMSEHPVSGGVDTEEVNTIISEYLTNHPVSGVKGDNGASAYGIAVANGYEGTEEEWLLSLKGDKGDSVTDEEISQLIGEYITEHPIEGVSEEQIAQSVSDYIENHPISGGESELKGLNVFFKNKKGVAFGTSITSKCSQYDNNGYIGVTKDILGLSEYFNNGMDGFPIAFYNGIGIGRTIENFSTIADYDLVTIEGGTNDFKLNLPIGELGAIGDTTFDKTTFYGALRSAIEYILTNNPTAYIVLIADPQRSNGGYDVNTVNTVGYKLIDYVNAMIKVGNMYGIPVCPWFFVSGITKKTLGTYAKDGLHPNEVGYTRLGMILAQAIVNQNTVLALQVESSNSSSDEPEPTPDEPEPTPDEPEPTTDEQTIISTGDTVTADGITFNIANSGTEPYKAIMKISDKYYLYLAEHPIHATATYKETVYGGAKRIADPGTHNFISSQAVSMSANDNGYYTAKQARTIDNYIWANHNITILNTDEVILNGTSGQ